MKMLSKSRFISGYQCHLKLWYDTYQRDLAPPPDEALQAVFDVGHRVGEVAQQRWLGGALVEGPHWEIDQAVERTRELMQDPSIPAIYEAAIVHEGVLTRVDVLARAPDGGWDLVEVKSSTRVKDPFDTDVALQYWILRNAGIEVRHAGVLVLNRDYVYPGGELDVDQLFRFEDLTADCEARLDETAERVKEYQAILRRREPPDVDIGPHCSTPYECPYWDHCARNKEFPEFPLDLLPSLNGNRREELEAQGIETIHEIPEDFRLSDTQARVRDCIVTGKPWVSPDLGSVLEEVEWPLYFLDFEAAGLAIPRYPDTRPYDAIPFQFSCHVQEEPGAELTHHEYLNTDGSDPRREIAETLLDTLGERGSIVVYSGYEAQMINALAKWLPDLAPRLHALVPRLYDLLKVIRRHYCHPDFRGSYSIKAVLPALVEDMSYDGMGIADGMAAVRGWLEIIDTEDPDARQKIETDLRAYCEQDSLAMLKLRNALRQEARTGP